MSFMVDGGSSPHAETTPPERASLGSTLGGRYVVTSLLGANEVGWVLAARDTRGGKAGASCVLHVLRPEHAPPGALARNLMQRELALLERVRADASEAALVRPVEREAIEDDGLVFFVTELVDGPSLAQLLAAQGAFSVQEARALGAPIARTLAVIHQTGFACGRLRTEDVLLRRGVLPVVVNLGLASRAVRSCGEEPARDVRRALARDAAPGEESGTPTPAGDVYRLGLLLRALVPPPPSRETSPYRAAESAARVRADASRGTPEDDFEVCVAACLAPEASGRPTAREVARWLAPRRGAVSRRVLLGVAGASVLAGAASAALWLRNEGRPRIDSPLPQRRRSAVSAAPVESPTIPPTPDDFGPVRLLEGKQAVDISAGWAAVVMEEGGRLWVWDLPTEGQLSEGRAPYAIAPVGGARRVAAGGSTILVLDGEGQLWGCPTQQPRLILLRELPKIRAVSAGYQGTALVTEEGAGLLLSYWRRTPGNGHRLGPFESLEELITIDTFSIRGLTDAVAVATMGELALALRRNGTVWAWEHRPHDEQPPVAQQVAGLTDIVDVAAGNEFRLALDADGAVWAWGSCDYKTCGGADSARTVQRIRGLPPIAAIDAGMNSGIALDDEGGVWEWGTRWGGNQVRNRIAGLESHPPHRIERLPPMKKVSTTGEYSLALSREGEVWAWGMNKNQKHWWPNYPHLD